VGQTVVFQATLTNPGSGGDTFDWSSLAAGLNCTSSTTDSISCRPTVAGTYDVSVTVTDSDSNSSTSGTLVFTVDSDPLVGTPDGSPSTVETGVGVSFTASPTGGSGTYAFSWAGLPSPCTSIDSASPNCHPATAGAYAVSVRVTDSNEFDVTSPTLEYTVTNGPTLTTPIASPSAPIDVGEWVNFSTTTSGGVSPYTYLWQNLPAGCSSTDLPKLECRPNGSGLSLVTVSVTDHVGGHATAGSLSFTVNSAVSIRSVTASASVVDLGRNVTFSALGASGGSGVYSYAWSDLPPGCAAANVSSVTCAPTQVGKFVVNVTVRDTLGGNATAGTPVTVVARPSVGSIGISRSSVDLGQTVDFSAQGLSGGLSPYRYAWTGLPGGCTSTNTTTLLCVPSAAGIFSVSLTVTDADDVSGSASIAYTIYALPSAATPTVSSGSPIVGQTFHLTSNATVGSGGLTYTWTGLPPGCVSADSSTLVCRPTTNGTYHVVVTVRDSNNGSASSSPLSLVVEPRAATPSSPAFPSYLLVAGLVALALGIAVAVVLVRRHKRAPPSGVR